MQNRRCRVVIEKSGRVTGTVYDLEEEIAQTSWYVGTLYEKNPKIALDLIHIRSTHWASIYGAKEVCISTEENGVCISP